MQSEREKELVEALKEIRALISEGALVGFNPLDGDWAEKLYNTQSKTYKLVK